MKNALETAFQAAMAHLDGLDYRSVDATSDAAKLRSRLAIELNEENIEPDRVIQDLVNAVEGGILGAASGRFFGWVVGGALPAALAADWLAAAWNNNAALYACGPAAAIVEEVAGAWLKDILGLPRHASFALVSGCQMAHVTSLAAARHALLAKRGWDVEEQGLYGAPPIRIISSNQRHGSIDRAVRLLGFGSSHVTYLTDIAEFESALDPSTPTIVMLQAGDINTGHFDSFATLIPKAKQAGAWVHIDAAFGLWAAASPRYRHLLRGVELADSWATDGHKWLNTPFDCGYAFIADPEAHRAAVSHRAAYLTHADDARDQIDWNPDWSRRARGFSTYAALRQLGRKGVAELVDRCCAHARSIVVRISEMPGAELVSEPVINQGMVRFLDPAGIDHDRRTDQVIAAINRTGEAFFTGTMWKGRRAMRVSVCNWRTSQADVERTLDCVKGVLTCQSMSV